MSTPVRGKLLHCAIGCTSNDATTPTTPTIQPNPPSSTLSSRLRYLTLTPNSTLSPQCHSSQHPGHHHHHSRLRLLPSPATCTRSEHHHHPPTSTLRSSSITSDSSDKKTLSATSTAFLRRHSVRDTGMYVFNMSSMESHNCQDPHSQRDAKRTSGQRHSHTFTLHVLHGACTL